MPELSATPILNSPPDLALRKAIRAKREELGYILAIIDDDPTGNQTVYDLPLLANWSVESLQKVLSQDPPGFFVLANTRSLAEREAIQRVKEIAHNLQQANQQARKKLLLISRSDSTLRGHFPAEVEALHELIDQEEVRYLLAPAMYEGKRLTWQGTQYLQKGQELIPVSETPYAQDPSFGYRHAYLPDWVAEKSNGGWPAEKVKLLPASQSSKKGDLLDSLEALRPGETGVVNAAHYADLDASAFAIWQWLAHRGTSSVVIRSSSSILPSLLGQVPQDLLSAHDLKGSNAAGGLVVVGSFVPTSTRQLAVLRAGLPEHMAIELDPERLLELSSEAYSQELSSQVNASLAGGHLTVLYTSRRLVKTEDKEGHLSLGQQISATLVEVIQSLAQAPSFLVAKGGITSHVLATEGLGMQTGQVRGQVLPGVPLWEMGPEARFPGMSYVVFPGNVGEEDSLLRLCQNLERREAGGEKRDLDT